ncbi:DUF6912 family protein [Glycomyces arizonensis]|uniref:DUF6912 family protein n=1 Tax=Glycomyces arizonensis TaxID=256035 RepID=UPI0003FEE1AB|nr:hypothetical protein [Glycomyces arizonensis]
MPRIYVPANAAMLRALADTGELTPAGPVHMVTRALRLAHPDADVEDLEYTAFDDAALTSVGLLAGQVPRRVVVSADVPGDRIDEHGDTAADFRGTVRLKKVAAVHIDDADAAALLASEEPDLAVLETHLLDWYAPSELQDLLSVVTGPAQ